MGWPCHFSPDQRPGFLNRFRFSRTSRGLAGAERLRLLGALESVGVRERRESVEGTSERRREGEGEGGREEEMKR